MKYLGAFLVFAKIFQVYCANPSKTTTCQGTSENDLYSHVTNSNTGNNFGVSTMNTYPFPFQPCLNPFYQSQLAFQQLNNQFLLYQYQLFLQNQHQQQQFILRLQNISQLVDVSQENGQQPEMDSTATADRQENDTETCLYDDLTADYTPVDNEHTEEPTPKRTRFSNPIEESRSIQDPTSVLSRVGCIRPVVSTGTNAFIQNQNASDFYHCRICKNNGHYTVACPRKYHELFEANTGSNSPDFFDYSSSPIISSISNKDSNSFTPSCSSSYNAPIPTSNIARVRKTRNPLNRCGICKEIGHNSRTCPQNDHDLDGANSLKVFASIGSSPGANLVSINESIPSANVAGVKKPHIIRCQKCKEIGHNSRTCKQKTNLV